MILSFELSMDFVPVQFILRANFKFGEKFQLETLHIVPCSVMLVVSSICSCVVIVRVRLCHCSGGQTLGCHFGSLVLMSGWPVHVRFVLYCAVFYFSSIKNPVHVVMTFGYRTGRVTTIIQNLYIIKVLLTISVNEMTIILHV
jgi:hypothetical protein